MNDEQTMVVIAIDGPAGAGKSTVGRRLAAHLGLSYLDTGAQFRTVGVAAMALGIEFEEAEQIAKLAHEFEALDDGSVTVAGIDYTPFIRTPEAGYAASKVAVIPAVRTELVARQRAWAAQHGGGVIEGRDIGSVVFPNATLKLYITASPEVRGARRSQETGEPVHEVIAAIRERDVRDKTRDTAPLTSTDDAIRIDTSDRTVDNIVDGIVALLEERQCQR